MKYLHVSRELLVRPRMALGSDGKQVFTGDFDFYLDRNVPGVTYRREEPKPPSKRDMHRMRSRTCHPHDWSGKYA